MMIPSCRNPEKCRHFNEYENGIDDGCYDWCYWCTMNEDCFILADRMDDVLKNIQCKKCAHFTPEWCEFKMDSLDPDIVRDCQYYRDKTNVDLIRSKTDEELAELFTDIQWRKRLEYPTRTAREWLEWLKKECE